MEGNPLDLVKKHKAGTRQNLAKRLQINPQFVVPLKVDARGRQQVNRVLRVHVVPAHLVNTHRTGIRKIKLEVELPRAHVLGEIPLRVRKRQSQLNHLEQVHVAPQRLVVVIRRRPKVANRSRYDAWKLRVLCCIRQSRLLGVHTMAT